MTDQQHPITPPPELVQEWSCDCPFNHPDNRAYYVATLAARWGWEQRGGANEAELQKARDEELEAWCEWFKGKGYHPEVYRDLCAARRPKPPSLKEQALDQLSSIQIDLTRCGMGIRVDTIRRALEALDD